MQQVCAFLALLAVAVALAPPAAAPTAESSAPTGLEAVYQSGPNAVTLTWQPPTGHDFSYMVWRDGAFLGTTDSTTFTDPLGINRDPGYVYFVSTVWQDNGGSPTVSAPAIDGVSTIACEVVTVATSWNWPYVHARLHEECLGVPYDKDTTWSRP